MSNNHEIKEKYILQIYHKSFDMNAPGIPQYITTTGANVWNIKWDEDIYKAKMFSTKMRANITADKIKNIIKEAAAKGITSLGYTIDENGHYKPLIEDIVVNILKIQLNILE